MRGGVEGGPGSPYELSLNLSRNRKMESKIKMDSTFITNIQYSIKVYQFAMKRESWK